MKTLNILRLVSSYYFARKFTLARDRDRIKAYSTLKIFIYTRESQVKTLNILFSFDSPSHTMGQNKRAGVKVAAFI